MIKGFTLIETLVAISILSIVMIAPFYAVEQSVNASDASRDELIGSMLAQEGVEYLRNTRDDDFLYNSLHPSATQSWLYGVDGSTSNSVTSPNCFAPYWCTVDPINNHVASQLNTTAVSALYLNASNLYTQQTSGAKTAFSRSVQLSCTTSGSCSPSTAQEVKVVVTVKWITRQTPYTTTVTEYLDNWLP